MILVLFELLCACGLCYGYVSCGLVCGFGGGVWRFLVLVWRVDLRDLRFLRVLIWCFGLCYFEFLVVVCLLWYNIDLVGLLLPAFGVFDILVGVVDLLFLVFSRFLVFVGVLLVLVFCWFLRFWGCCDTRLCVSVV